MTDHVDGSISLDSHHDEAVVVKCPLGTRLGEHTKKTEKVGMKVRTRSMAQETEAQCLKTAVSEHCSKENHLMNWEDCKVLESESNKIRRWIKENMW